MKKVVSIRRFGQVYQALLRAGWGRALEYRAQVVLWVLSSVFPLVMMVVWLALVDEAGPIAGWGKKDFISYYVAAAVVNQLTFSWIIWQWDQEIRTGDLSTKLLKPLDPVHQLVSEQLGQKFFIIFFILPIVVAITILSPLINYPISPSRLVATSLAVAAGYAVSLTMSCAFGMLSFWSTQSSNLYSLWWGVGSFLSGWIAPLAMFPTPVRQVAHWLPFRSLLSFPIEILIGQLTEGEIVQGFAVTLTWILIFLIAYRVLWRNGLKRYEAVGA